MLEGLRGSRAFFPPRSIFPSAMKLILWCTIQLIVLLIVCWICCALMYYFEDGLYWELQILNGRVFASRRCLCLPPWSLRYYVHLFDRLALLRTICWYNGRRSATVKRMEHVHKECSQGRTSQDEPIGHSFFRTRSSLSAMFIDNPTLFSWKHLTSRTRSTCSFACIFRGKPWTTSYIRYPSW